jgi:hypothetical protein
MDLHKAEPPGEPYHIYFHLMVQEKIIWAIQQPNDADAQSMKQLSKTTGKY